MPTEPMNDAELRPCDNCGNPHRSGIVKVVDVNVAIANNQAIRERAGLSIMLGSSMLAEVMSSHQSVMRLNTDPELKTRLYLCNECFCGDLNLAMLSEKISEIINAAK